MLVNHYHLRKKISKCSKNVQEFKVELLLTEIFMKYKIKEKC